MYRTRHAKLVGFLFLAPALLFVAVFTLGPLLGMIWISFHNWSLITPPKFVGPANFARAFGDDQFWVSLLFSLKYTLFLTPILMVGGYLLALLTVTNSPLRRVTRTMVFIPVVIGLGASSLLWYWLFSPDHGFVNRILSDLGLIDAPVLWLGVDADLSLWAIMGSVTWKVIGFGMILFIGAIQAIPREVDEASMVDGASPLAAPDPGDPAAHDEDRAAGHADQRHRLAAGLRPVLHHDRGPAAEPDGHLGLLRVPQLVPVPQAGLRGRPVARAGHARAVRHGRAGHPHPPELHVSADVAPAGSAGSAGSVVGTSARRIASRTWSGRNRYLTAAVCVAICALMISPIVLSISASLKTTAEAAAVPPTYLPSELSLDSYQRLWDYQQGLPVYLANSFLTAMVTILFALGLTIPAGYALARFPIPGKEFLFLFLLLALIIPYQALLTPMFLMFANFKLTNTVIGLAIVHTTIQLPFSLYVMRNNFESVPRELEEAAVIDGGGPIQVLVKVFLPSLMPAVVTVALFAFITSWNEFLGAIVMMSKESAYTLPVILAIARTETSLGGTDWGMLQAGVTISIIPCVAVYLLLQRYYVSGLLSGAVK